MVIGRLSAGALLPVAGGPPSEARRDAARPREAQEVEGRVAISEAEISEGADCAKEHAFEPGDTDVTIV